MVGAGPHAVALRATTDEEFHVSGIVIGLLIVLVILVLVALLSGVRVVQEYERGIVFRLGRVVARPKGPGLFFILPFGIDRMVKVNLQTVAMNVPPQDVITRDNVTVRVDAVIYFQVVDPLKAVVAIQNYLFGTSQVAQTTLRATLGRVDLDDLLSERERINDELARVIDDLTEPWGVKVTLVEIKDVDLPDTMQRAMARQAEAERDRRARIISAEGEFQASQKLSEAAQVMAANPQSLQLRFLQTVAEVAAERNSTLVMPIPVELLNFFQGIETGINRLTGGPAPERPAPTLPQGEAVGARTGPMPIERPTPDSPDSGRGPATT
jgi:regulator of protease activity HflC (stomatin/prohibitin superfamily)